MRLPAAVRWLPVAVLAAVPAAAQAPGPNPAPGAVFQPLRADPKEPQFFAAYLWERSPRLAARLGSVGFGQTIGVVNGRTWQVAIAAAVFTHSPADLKPGVLHGGVEYRQRGVLVRFGPLATGRVVAALDAKSFQDRRWDVGWSAITGLELGDPVARGEGGWRWSLLLRAYTGPAPYGEFFRDRVASLGVGLGLAR